MSTKPYRSQEAEGIQISRHSENYTQSNSKKNAPGLAGAGANSKPSKLKNHDKGKNFHSKNAAPRTAGEIHP